MNEEGSTNEFTTEHQSEASLIATLNKIQQQLVYLEKKIDTLIQATGKSPEKVSGNRFDRKPEYREGRYEKKPFNKSFGAAPYGKPKMYGEKKFDGNFTGGKPAFDNKKKKFVPNRHKSR